jgi:hypothetical protein
MRESGFTVLITVTIALSACGPRLGAVPSPTETLPPVCSPAPSFGVPIDASYPSGVLQGQQGMVPVVGMDRLEPMEPALEYFAGLGIANGTNIAKYVLTQAGSTSAEVRICRDDGTVIVAEMYQPFASASTPIWAVRSYRLGR